MTGISPQYWVRWKTDYQGSFGIMRKKHIFNKSKFLQFCIEVDNYGVCITVHAPSQWA